MAGSRRLQIRGRLAGALAACAVVLLTTRVGDAKFVYPSFEERLLQDGTELVARVHLTDREPITFERDGREEVCGYRYRADVVESLRGPDGAITFFAEWAIAAPGEDRLLVANPWGMEWRRTELEGCVRSAENTVRVEARLRCELGAGERWVADGRMFMAFDEPARVAIGEDEWLRAPSADDPSPGPRIPVVQVSGPAGNYTVVRWNELRAHIQQVLAGSAAQPASP